MKTLITLNSGLIGSYLCEKLSRDYETFGLDPRCYPYNYVIGNVRDFTALLKTCGLTDDRGLIAFAIPFAGSRTSRGLFKVIG